MALIKLGPVVSEARGSVGGTTFSRNGSGPYMRQRVTPVNPKTVPQEAVRVAMSILSVRWVTILTAVQRAAWDAYALSTPIPNRLGDLINVGGRQMFMRTNVTRQLIAIGIIDAAPVTPGVADAPVALYTGDTTNGIEAGITSPILGGADIVSITIGLFVNQSVNFYATPYTFAVGILAATGLPVLIKPAAEVFVGQRYFLEARFFQTDGKVSFPVRDHVDILA